VFRGIASGLGPIDRRRHSASAANGSPHEWRSRASVRQTIEVGVTLVSRQNASPAIAARGQAWPERPEVINVAGDAFYHAELRVCGTDAPERG
jgi:hypothetical protein